jgi:hypothetical protein
MHYTVPVLYDIYNSGLGSRLLALKPTAFFLNALPVLIINVATRHHHLSRHQEGNIYLALSQFLMWLRGTKHLDLDSHVCNSSNFTGTMRILELRS